MIHQQPGGGRYEEYSLAVLRQCGYDVRTTDAECCGMAGSFGYKQQYYELSMDVGSNLRPSCARLTRTTWSPAAPPVPTRSATCSATGHSTSSN